MKERFLKAMAEFQKLQKHFLFCSGAEASIVLHFHSCFLKFKVLMSNCQFSSLISRHRFEKEALSFESSK